RNNVNAERHVEEEKAEQVARQRRREREREAQQCDKPATLSDTSLWPGPAEQPLPIPFTVSLAPDSFWDGTNYDLEPDLNASAMEEDERLERDLESAKLWCDERLGEVVGSDDTDEEERN
ncbi:hypothetical protein PQX77_003284, partial [Marasmius sp. AFHP31]